MYIMIESNGSKDHNEISDFIKDIAEDDFGFTVETVTGDEKSPIIIYTDVDSGHPVELVRFIDKPDTEVVKFYLEQYLNDEEEPVKPKQTSLTDVQKFYLHNNIKGI